MPIFPSSSVKSKHSTTPLIPRCGGCGLYKGCESPKMPVTGRGRGKVLVVAEAPGAVEDRRGEQLVGDSGQLFRDELELLGWDLDEDCWKTNSIICRPPVNEIKDKYIIACRPNLNKTIEELKPDVILLLGESAVKSLISQEWTESIGKIGRWVGWQIPSHKWNAWLCPTWHPAYLLRREKDEILRLWFRNHLKAALGLEGKPWEKVPDWENEIGIFWEPDETAGMIECLSGIDEPVSFDYETDRLKPDHRDSKIVCCAVSSGVNTITYKWEGEAKKATGELLRSKTPKYGWNIKFENKWTKKEFGHGVRNWVWDGMIASHVLDNRPGITSAKFQAYVQLGQPTYDDVISPYLKAKGGNDKNRIDEVGDNELLKYCGMDALLEWKLAEKQMEMMK